MLQYCNEVHYVNSGRKVGGVTLLPPASYAHAYIFAGQMARP